MKHVLLAFLFLFNCSVVFAQASAQNGQWLAPACKPKTFGLHNANGDVAAEAKFDMLEEGDGTGWIAFSEGKYGVINSSGNWIIKPGFQIIVQFLNGKAVAGKKLKIKKSNNSNDNYYSSPYRYDDDNYNRDSAFYYGVIDASGVWIIEPVHEFIRLSKDGSAQYADANNKFGFLNADGSIMIRAQYDYASRMQNGVAIIGEPVKTDAVQYNRYGSYNRFRAGKYSVIDRNGNKLHAEPYELIREYSEGRATFNKGGIWKGSRYGSENKLLGGKWGFLDESGKEIIAPDYDYASDFVNGKAKVRSGQRIFWIDKDGKETTPPTPGKNDKAFTIFCSPGFFGYIGLDGKYVIEPQYYVAKEFSEGLAAVMPLRASDMDCDRLPGANSKEYETSHRGYSGMLNKLLNLDRDYGIDFDASEDAQMLQDSIKKADSLMSLRRLYGYADKTGNMVLPAKYEVALPFHNGCAYVLFREKWGVIDTKGNWIFAPVLEWPGELSAIRYDYHRDEKRYYEYGLEEADVYGYNNRYLYGKTSLLYSFSEGMGCIFKYNKYGFIDTTGKIIAAPVYDEVKPFANGLAAVRHGSNWGYIDKTGKEIIPFRYRSAGDFTVEGLACVSDVPKRTGDHEADVAAEYENSEQHYFGYIDKKGNWVIKPQFTDAANFSNGLASVSLDYQKFGYIDKNGKFVIPPKYNRAGNFVYGFALVRINMYEAVYIDKTGKVSKTFTQAHPPRDKSIPLRPLTGTNNYFGFVNEKDEVVIPYQFSKAGNFVIVD